MAMSDGMAAQPTSAEAIAEIRKRWQSVVGISAAFSMQAAANYGFMGWAVEYFLRVHHWGAGETTRALGTLIVTCGVAGLYIGASSATVASQRGYRCSAAGVDPECDRHRGVSDGGDAGADAATESDVCGSGPVRDCAADGCCQRVANLHFPNQFRGFVTALYLFILNLGGLPIGNYVPGLLTTKFFQDPLKVGTSAAITIGVCGTLMLLLILATRSKYREHYRMMHPQG